MRRALLHLSAALLLGTTPGTAVTLATTQDAPPAITPAQPVPAAQNPCSLPPEPLPSKTRTVIVLDTSGSMRGIGDGQANIFGPVKESIRRYVQQSQPDQLELLTFDSGLKTRRSYALPANDAQFQLDLSNLRANGSNTWLYRSLTAALSPLTGREQYITNVFVLTDGIDNERGRRDTAASALASFTGRGPLDSLTYIALGTDIPSRARRALQASDYASGLTMPVGQVPDLSVGIGTSFVTVTDAAHVPAPYADGTSMTVAGPNVSLVTPQVQGGEVQLSVSGRVAAGTHALLCATPLHGEGNLSGLRPQRTLLTLNLARQGGLLGLPAPAQPAGLTPALAADQGNLLWLNPGVGRTIKPGEDVVLRYRAGLNVPLDELGTAALLPGDQSGLRATLEHQPGAHEFAVRLHNLGSEVAQTVTPRLQVGSGQLYQLPPVTLQAGQVRGQGRGQVQTPAQVTPPSSTSTPAPQPFDWQHWNWRRWLWLPLLLLLLPLLWFLWRWLSAQRKKTSERRREQVLERSTPTPPPVPVAEAPAVIKPIAAPAIQGIEYRADRTLALFTAQGEMRSMPTPLGGPFDIGMLAKVPLLSGLRVEQHRDGLRVLNVPSDLEVSQGGRLLFSGDIVRPGTLLGVAVAKLARAPHPPLGTLVGLGIPLELRPVGTTLHVVGPYGTHTLELAPGVTDLGEAFSAAALAGLKVSPAGDYILLADLPDDLNLHIPGEAEALRPGTYLPPEVLVSLPKL